ncbi:hypothetical protein SAMN04515648_4558 [Phyllobacterium sp. CL33Tsu]|uniref:hypothetical protein n=1 Tax=Phyllobacterium sp. CL33Tsu TaxID=1798191 RepID=UPI0008EE860E|nr:hypothetical protein [Phyllobacterium sp. CL33Tsu]SFJ55089.1 hypothetical protein SAMN04515648_4558 [Phyllobacterium sp. CL33Tsu]
MAITFPYDLLTEFPGWSTEFDLLWRQEQSRMAGGQTIVKDLGSPLWTAAFQSRLLKPNELDRWRARFKALENGLNQFRAWSKSRCYPIAYPGGVGIGTVSGLQLDTIATSRKAIRIKNLPAGYTGRVGDYIEIGNGNLHQVIEDFTASGAGLSPLFEIRPHLWPVTAINDAVSVLRPACLMTLVPGSFSSTADIATGRAVIAFQAMESR